MAKKYFILLLAAMALLPSFSVQVQADPVDLNLGYVDPEIGKSGQQRSPIAIPEVDIDDYTLSFITPCDGCTLQLVDEDGFIVYTTVIPNGTTNLVLPSYLSGDYEIQIVRGNFYFYGYINL